MTKKASHISNQAAQGSDYFFDPALVTDFAPFSQFAKSDFGKKVIENMNATPLGNYMVRFAMYVDPIVAFDDIPFLSLYVPVENNLDGVDYEGEGIDNDEVPVLLFDTNDVDQTILPYLMASQLFRLMQDMIEPDNKRIIPMMQNSICYNPTVRIDSKSIFTKDYADMERACDVVALTVLHQMRSAGVDMQSFGYMRAQEQTQAICDAIAHTAAYAEKSGLTVDNPELAMDLMLYMGDLVSKQSIDYNAALATQAASAYEETMKNPGFEAISGYMPYMSDDEFDEEDIWDDEDGDFEDVSFEDLDDATKAQIIQALNEMGIDPDTVEINIDNGENYTPPPYNSFQYALVSDTYEDRDWGASQWIEIVNNFLVSENQDRAERISDAFNMAAKNKAEREKAAYLAGDDIEDSAKDKKASKDKPEAKGDKAGPKAPKPPKR